MNPELQQLEAELKQLRPTAPSTELKNSIEARIDNLNRVSKSSERRILPFGPIITGMAASFALVMGLHLYEQSSSAPPVYTVAPSSQTSAASASSDYEPVHAEQQLTNAVEDGIFLNDDNQPVHKFRYQFVDSVTLKNRNDGALYSMMVPREEVVLVPVSLL